MEDNKSLTKLVSKGELDTYLKEVLDKEKAVVEDIRKILPFLKEEDLKKSLEKKLVDSENRIAALEAGFIPVDVRWATNVETKSKWLAPEVKEMLSSMPQEAKEAMERVKSLGIFGKIEVAGTRRGDPTLVGNAGGMRFLIANWIRLDEKRSIGFVVRS